MAEPKTQQTDASVSTFLSKIEDVQQRKDCQTLAKLMQKITGERPHLWGTSIVGFGSTHYEYASGRQGDWPLTGFAPRRRSLSVYLMDGFGAYRALMKRLGKHKTGKSCLTIQSLAEIDLEVLDKLITRSVAQMRRAHP